MRYDEDSYDISKLIGKMINSYNGMMEVINHINAIMNKTKILSLNSSIEAARAGAAGRGFLVIATEISNFSKQSQDATNEGRKHMKDLNADINSVVGVRTADVAYDLMDKIDRSMYERKCDIITWSRLRAVRELADNCTEEKQEEVNQLLHEYVEVFDVYEEIVVVDANGKIIATGNNKDYIGKDYSNEDWFKRCMRQNDGHISDMFYSEKLKKYTMSFSCPIVTENGKKVGVISSRLNWEAVYDIIDRAKIGETGEVYVINKTGEVIASKNRMDILNRNLTDAYSAARDVISGKEYGYEIEDINGEITAIIGYAHTKGYKTFPGKEWSVVVKEVF